MGGVGVAGQGAKAPGRAVGLPITPDRRVSQPGPPPPSPPAAAPGEADQAPWAPWQSREVGAWEPAEGGLCVPVSRAHIYFLRC